ncbi:head-tail connector protein [Staphylococcus agnetis]|uniref:head-tail connector protein n=1 Tax=Staphylococcus agnetis TaxID=985762 RepID=UPI00071F6EA6|nr:head-tail connector protein [Staphylococcus agnetis]ALN76064.1 phage gp6-like head-tail connector protein [Staphylococcus agnetis]NJI12029.1 phage gp6-like head-tail connector protein [Staphylococcus agnetis]
MLTLNLEEVKNRIRVDHDFDDEEIQGLIYASEQQIQGAVSGYKKADAFYKDNNLYYLAVINQVGHHYENRSSTSQFQRHSVSQSSLALIQTLRGAYAVWKLEN